MKKLAFLLYAWGTTFLFGFLIYWLATIPNLSAGDSVTDEVVKVIFRMVLYAIFFILIYRSIILTLKTTVERLAKWRSKKEEHEDAEFVLIIETLIVILVIFGTITFAFFEEHIQYRVQGRNGENITLAQPTTLPEVGQVTLKDGNVVTYYKDSVIRESEKDILVSIMSVLLTAIVVYSIPVLGELEVAIKHKLEDGVFKKRD